MVVVWVFCWFEWGVGSVFVDVALRKQSELPKTSNISTTVTGDKNLLCYKFL